MRFFAGKVSKFLVLSAAATLLLTASAFAAEQAIGVGATTGTSVRIRSEASTSSSIITTLDKGTALAILSPAADGWYRVAFNGSTGYISADYVVEDQDGAFEASGRVNADGVTVRAAATTDSEVLASVSTNAPVTVTGFADGWYAVTCQYGTEGYIRSDFVDLTTAAGQSSSGSGIVSSAMQHLGTRYVYGGASPSGFDCSGFTMYIYNQYGVSLPHTASGQWQSGKGAKIWSVGELQPGDLVFFNDPSRNAGKACSHAGIYIGGGEFIHASSARSGGVVISNLTSGYYNTYFVGGLRIL